MEGWNCVSSTVAEYFLSAFQRWSSCSLFVFKFNLEQFVMPVCSATR